MDLVSTTLDGAGPLHALTARQRPRASRTLTVSMARALAQSTNSGLVVFGGFMPLGSHGDSVQLRATLLNGVTGRLTDFEVVGDTADMVRLADSTSMRVLRILGQTRAIGAVPTTYIGSRSMNALRSFLQGEQLYRQNLWTEAKARYEAAVAEDSGYTLAIHRLRNVTRDNEEDSASMNYALRAGALNHRLSRRDSLLVAADSLYAAETLDKQSAHPAIAIASPVWWAMLRRRLAILRQSTTDYPSDPEGWVELGEAFVHKREWLGPGDPAAILHPFMVSIQFDSAWAPAYYHAMELGMRALSGDSVSEIVARNSRLTPSERPARDLSDLLSANPSVSQAALARMESMNAAQLESRVHTSSAGWLIPANWQSAWSDNLIGQARLPHSPDRARARSSSTTRSSLKHRVTYSWRCVAISERPTNTGATRSPKCCRRNTSPWGSMASFQPIASRCGRRSGLAHRSVGARCRRCRGCFSGVTRRPSTDCVTNSADHRRRTPTSPTRRSTA